jgi:hypothetical protein
VRIRHALILFSAAAFTACSDNLGPQDWNATPDTITIFSLSRPDLLGFPSAYDFANRRQIQVETPGTAGAWDVALGSPNNTLQLIPAGDFQGIDSRARIAVINGSFEDLKEAPRDSASFTSSPIPLQTGGVYVVRTRRVGCGFSTAVHYAKLKAVTLDNAAGFATFAVVVNPLCNDRSFVPPK